MVPCVCVSRRSDHESTIRCTVNLSWSISVPVLVFIIYSKLFIAALVLHLI